MNRKNNKRKGFTIVELVIVISVIAILAGVMIPTFGGIIDKANESNRDSIAKNALTTWLGNDAKNMDGMDGYIVVDNDYYYEVTDGRFDATNSLGLENNNKPATAPTTTNYGEKTARTAGYEDLPSNVKILVKPAN